MSKINLVVIDDFISLEDQENLIKDLKSITLSSARRIHGGRFFLPNTDQTFSDLLMISNVWSRIYEKINSIEFLEYSLELLKYNKNDIVFEKFFTREKSQYFKKIQQLGEKRPKELSFSRILAYLFFRIYQYIIFKKFRIKNYLLGRISTELLFDVSVSENGYHREIHRDSDSRMIVFILYLNKLDGGAGGSLDLHEYFGNEIDDPPCQPSIRDCKIIKSIQPLPGRLVIFENNNEAFHSVPIMKGYNQSRYFCYGSFTVTSGRNPFLRKSKHKLKTEWNLYF